VADTVLALNCGSSSVKFAGFAADRDDALFRGQVEGLGPGLTASFNLAGADAPPLPDGVETHADVIAFLLETVIADRRIAAVGHRVVHGGTVFDGPVAIDDAARRRIEDLSDLAPAHQPHNLAGIDAVARALPTVPQVACFDTAFHRTIPAHRRRMPLPRRFHEEGLCRFGFHGLSYERVAARLPALLGARADGRVVVCHLGNGCSLAGLIERRCAHTSMGFTPLDGLMMGRRPGRLDPGAVLWLVERHGGDVAAVDRLLNKEAGLVGVSGVSSDMRVLLADTGADAALAVTMFVDRLVQEIGSAMAAIGGLDALVFTGGIGENAVPIRARVVNALAWTGLDLDRAANEAADAAAGSTITTGDPSAHVVATDEEAVIAAAARRIALSEARAG
jgi:acetate kinase